MTRVVIPVSTTSWTFASCLACRQQALIDPLGTSTLFGLRPA